MGADSLFKGLKVNLEVVDLRGNEYHFGPRAFNEYLIFGEIGGKYDKLVLGAGQSAEDTAERGGRPYGDIELVGGVAGPKTAVQGVGESLAGLCVALGTGVAVDQFGLFPQNADGGLVDRVGGGNAGIAQREIKDVFRADNSGPLLAVLKQLTDHRPGGAQSKHTFRNHGDDLLMKNREKRTGTDLLVHYTTAIYQRKAAILSQREEKGGKFDDKRGKISHASPLQTENGGL